MHSKIRSGGESPGQRLCRSFCTLPLLTSKGEKVRRRILGGSKLTPEAQPRTGPVSRARSSVPLVWIYRADTLRADTLRADTLRADTFLLTRVAAPRARLDAVEAAGFFGMIIFSAILLTSFTLVEYVCRHYRSGDSQRR